MDSIRLRGRNTTNLGQQTPTLIQTAEHNPLKRSRSVFASSNFSDV